MGDYRTRAARCLQRAKDLAEEISKYGGKDGHRHRWRPEADIEVARRIGCTKVNIDTDLRLTMTAAIRKVMFENPKEFDPREYLAPARNKVEKGSCATDQERHSAAPVTPSTDLQRNRSLHSPRGPRRLVSFSVLTTDDHGWESKGRDEFHEYSRIQNSSFVPICGIQVLN